MTRQLGDLPPYIYGTTRLGAEDVSREQQVTMARAVIDAGLWMHTSRQYHHALEVLGEVFAEDRSRIPKLVVKLGGGTADTVRATLAENTGPLGIDSIAIGQLNPVDELAEALISGGPVLADLQRIKDEGLVERFVLEIFPWTSSAPLAALRGGHLEGLVDGFITYFNPLQRFGSNELWDELLASDQSIISMRTVSGAHVHTLRDVPGAAWRPYLQERAAEVAPIFDRSGSRAGQSSACASLTAPRRWSAPSARRLARTISSSWSRPVSTSWLCRQTSSTRSSGCSAAGPTRWTCALNPGRCDRDRFYGSRPCSRTKLRTSDKDAVAKAMQVSAAP